MIWVWVNQNWKPQFWVTMLIKSLYICGYGGFKPATVRKALTWLVIAIMKAVVPNIRHMPCHKAVLLSAPVSDQTAVDAVLSSKLAVFRRLASRLTMRWNTVLVYRSRSILYAVRNATRAPSSQTMMTLLDRRSVIVHVNLSDVIWKQATLPVSSGGLSICLTMDIALPVFLSPSTVHQSLVTPRCIMHFIKEIGFYSRIWVMYCIILSYVLLFKHALT